MPTAFVLIRCEEGAEDKIMDNFRGKDIIKEIQPTIGHYDFVAKITSPDVEHLDKVIGTIRGDDKVRSTKVLTLYDASETA